MLGRRGVLAQDVNGPAKPDVPQAPPSTPPAEGSAPPAEPVPPAGGGAPTEPVPPSGEPTPPPAEVVVPPPAEAGAVEALVPEDKVEEIVVTARKKNESVQDVPISVTAFSKAQLERATVRDLSDLQSLAPNVLISSVPVTPGGASLTIRGISFGDNEKTFDPAIGVILDGVYIGTMTTQLLNNFDLEEVEILRGPQGTLFGRNTTGGIINVRRSRPTGKYGVKGSVIVGSYGRNDYKLVMNAPLIEEKLAVKVSGYSLNGTGYLYNTTTKEHNPKQHYLSGAVDLLYTPTKSFEVLLKYEHIRDRSTSVILRNSSNSTHILCDGPSRNPPGTTFTDPQCGDPKQPLRHVESTFRDDADLDLDAVTLSIEKRLNEQYKLVSVSGFRGHDEDVFQDFDGSAEDFFSTRRTQRYDQVSEELRFHASPVKTVQLVTGLYYFYSHYDMNQTLFFLLEQPAIFPGPKGTVRIQDSGQTTHSVAGFVHGEWEFVKNLTGSLGGRYTVEKKIFNNNWFMSNYLDPEAAVKGAEAAPEPAKGSQDWAQFTPATSLGYKLTDNLLGDGNAALVYANYARGFKSGGFNGRADPATAATYNPEIVDQYEAGVKTDWAKRRYVLNTAVFWTEFVNKQEEQILSSDTGGQQTLTQNAAEAVIRGLEFEGSAMPLRGHNGLIGGLRLSGNLGLLSAQYRHFFADLNGPDASGKLKRVDNSAFQLRNAPAWQFGVSVSNPYELSFGRFTVDAQYRRRDSMRGATTFKPGEPDPVTGRVYSTDQPDNRGILPQQGQCDASLSLEADELLGGAWRATLFGRNLFNERPQIAYIDVGGLFAFSGYQGGLLLGAEIAAKY